jgi:signal transduction histidine kinase
VLADTRDNIRCAGLLKGDTAQTCITAPIKAKGKTIGAVFVARDAKHPFAEEDVELVCAVGSQVGTILENAQLSSKTEALAVLQERERVAREVHDGLAQTLGYMNIQLGIVDQHLSGGHSEKAQAELDEMAQVTREAYQELRQAIADLRTPLSSTGGLRRSLRECAEKFTRQTAIACHFEGHRGLPAVISPTAEVQLVRIVQEALANVRKHAPGSEVWLNVEASEREARVAIRDNGPGFDVNSAASQGRQFGLVTMKERAEGIGGKLFINSRPGLGTTVEVIVPTQSGKKHE